MRVARRYRFSASHRLHSPTLSDEENDQLYGKCNNPYGHGHDYVLEVVVRGEADARTGLILPIPQLDRLVKQTILGPYDHRYINVEVDSFQDTVPTTENIARDMFERLRQSWAAEFPPSAQLEIVRIWETRRNIVEAGRN